nr:hypothetical protein [Paracoccus saliphilus]
MISDTSSLKQGERDLDSLARTGSRVEGTLTINAKSIERAMANVGATMGGLDRTMKSLEAAVSQSMGRTAQEAQKGARSFEDLRRAIDPAYAASQRFAEVQRELAAVVASGEASQRAANIVLEQAASRYMGVATAAERAEQVQREQAQAVAAATGNYQALRAALDPVYASSKRYEQAQETLTAAVKQGVISQQEMNRVLAMAERQMLAPATGMRGLAGAADDAGKGLARFAPNLTNASFQIQDFAVQVASGQSALIAFTQQFPQLAGVMGFSGKIALWGAGLGTLVAVGAAVAPMLLDMSSAADKAEKAMDGLKDAVSRYNQFADVASKSQADLMSQFGTMASQARAANEVLAQFARLDAIAAMDQAVKDLTGTFGGLSDRIVFSRIGGTMQEWQETAATIRGELNLTEVQANNVVASLYQFKSAAVGEDQIAAAVRFKEQMVATFGSIEKMPKELQAVAKQALLLAASAAELVDPLERARQEQQRMADAAAGVIAKFDQQAAMSQAITRFGADSAQVEALKRDEATRAARALAEQHNISGPLADQLVRSAMAAFDAASGADQAAVALRNAEVAARALASALAAAGGFTGNLQDQISVIQARIDAQRSGADAAIAGQKKSMQLQAEAHRQAMLDAGESEFAAQTAYLRNIGLINQLGEMTTQERALAEANREAARASTKGASEAEKASKKAATEAKRQAEALDKEAEKWGELLSPVKKYQNAMSDLAALKGRLSDEEMAQAQRKLNVELADSLPLAGEFVDIMTTGLLNKFDGTLKSMWNMLKQWLANAMAMAAKNSIVMSMGIGGGAPGAVASAAGGVPGVGGAGGVMGGLMGGAGTIAGAALSGASGFLTAAGGGFGSAATYTSFMLKGATSGLAGFGAALGAIALPLAAVAAVFSFFKTKTKQLDAGLRVTIDGMDALTETFNKVEKKKFWGLSKKVRTYYDDADSETQRAVENAINGLQAGVLSAAKVLGFGAQTFKDFAHSIQISTKGMSEEDAQKALMEAIGGVSDAYARMIPGLQRFATEGETATQTLTRLSQSLVGVNGIMDTLGHRFRAAGLKGAALASDIAALFGGLEAMATATQRYYEAFYTEAERLKVTTRQTRSALADLGIAMPKTRAEYRAIIEALDLTTVKGRKTYAALIGMADAMDLILPKISGFTKDMERLQNRIVNQIGTVIGHLNDAIRANQAAASDWRKAGDGIRDYLDKLRGTASALVSPMQARAYNRALYGRTLRAAQGGDSDAAGRLTGAAGNYLGSVNDTAKSRVEAALAQARVAAQLGKVAIRADTTAAALDRVAGLQQRQVDILTRVQEHIAAGNSLTKVGITKLLGQLGGLDERIARRAGDAGTIVAGVSDALGNTSVTASLKGADGLHNSMGALRTSLVDLRKAIAAETARTQRQQKVAALNRYVGKLTANAAGNHFVDNADLAAMSKAAGINTTGLNTNQIRNRLAAFDGGDLLKGTVYDPTGSQERAYVEKERLKQEVAGMYGTIRQMMTQYGVTTANPFVLNNKGVRSNPHTGHFFINGRHITDHSHPFWNTLWGSGGLWARFTAAETALKNVPGFALGGSHVGGLRIVGENGPELEATGASRIYSNSQTQKMLDNRAVVAGLREVAKRLEAVETFTRKTSESTTSSDKTLKRIDALGVKIDPEQNLVSGTTTIDGTTSGSGGSGDPVYDIS